MLVPCFSYILENCKKKGAAPHRGGGGGGGGPGFKGGGGGGGGWVLRISSDRGDRMGAKMET